MRLLVLLLVLLRHLTQPRERTHPAAPPATGPAASTGPFIATVSTSPPSYTGDQWSYHVYVSAQRLDGGTAFYDARSGTAATAEEAIAQGDELARLLVAEANADHADWAARQHHVYA